MVALEAGIKGVQKCVNELVTLSAQFNEEPWRFHLGDLVLE